MTALGLAGALLLLGLDLPYWPVVVELTVMAADRDALERETREALRSVLTPEAGFCVAEARDVGQPSGDGSTETCGVATSKLPGRYWRLTLDIATVGKTIGVTMRVTAGSDPKPLVKRAFTAKTPAELGTNLRTMLTEALPSLSHPGIAAQVITVTEPPPPPADQCPAADEKAWLVRVESRWRTTPGPSTTYDAKAAVLTAHREAVARQLREVLAPAAALLASAPEARLGMLNDWAIYALDPREYEDGEKELTHTVDAERGSALLDLRLCLLHVRMRQRLLGIASLLARTGRPSLYLYGGTDAVRGGLRELLTDMGWEVKGADQSPKPVDYSAPLHKDAVLRVDKARRQAKADVALVIREQLLRASPGVRPSASLELRLSSVGADRSESRWRESQQTVPGDGSEAALAAAWRRALPAAVENVLLPLVPPR